MHFACTPPSSQRSKWKYTIKFLVKYFCRLLFLFILAATTNILLQPLQIMERIDYVWIDHYCVWGWFSDVYLHFGGMPSWTLFLSLKFSLPLTFVSFFLLFHNISTYKYQTILCFVLYLAWFVCQITMQNMKMMFHHQVILFKISEKKRKNQYGETAISLLG